jgi:hypothetical protein
VNTGAVPHEESFGPKTLKVTVPVRATPGAPVTVAVSETEDPSGTAGDETCVVIVGWFGKTVMEVMFRDVPVMVPPVIVADPDTIADRVVWIPGVPGKESVVGLRRTLNVKLIVQVLPAAPGRASTMAGLAVKV